MAIEDKHERRIVRRIMEHAEKQGWLVSVNDGENYYIKRVPPSIKLIKDMNITGQDVLLFRNYDHGYKIGSVWLVYGNGEDLIVDNTDNDLMAGLCDYATKG